MVDGDRLVQLVSEYGRAKFGDEWWPGNAQPHLGKKDGAELEALLDSGDFASDEQALARTVDLLNDYGRAKFGDEWWPGNAKGHIGKVLGTELEELLGAFDAARAPRP